MSGFAMASGHLVDVGDFKPSDISLRDIAHHLSKIQRYNGALPIDVSYSVAEHSINLVQHAMSVGGFSTLALRILLLHDASEAYLSDVVSPAKKHLPDYKVLEDNVERVINKTLLNFNGTIRDVATLKKMDARIVIDEIYHISPHLTNLYRYETRLEALGCHIHYNNHPSTVKTCFLSLAKHLNIVDRG